MKLNRRQFISQSIKAGSLFLTPWPSINTLTNEISRKRFGNQFSWGVSTAAYQIEGAYNEDGKGESIWDRFTHEPGNVLNDQNGDVACDYYHRYPIDIQNISTLNLDNYRFSLAWSRIFPAGIGTVNQPGVDFYHRVIDLCLELNIEPWITLYHWDLPQALEDQGGWTNRDIVNWFAEYVDFCTREYGDKVKNWMILNEPMAFVGLGYMLGVHAPGRKGFKNFLPAVHHATLCQAEGGRIARNNVVQGNIGSTFSLTYLEPFKDKNKHENAVRRMDALLNRLFIEPALGLGYPIDDFKALRRLEKYFAEGDEERMIFDFDFTGVQYYFRTIGKFSLFPPVLFAKEVPAEKREVPVNAMGLEIYPPGIYEILKKIDRYEGVRKIIVTENGVSFEDHLKNGEINDPKRIEFFNNYLQQVLKAKEEGVKVDGYFIWTLMDNFEWAEGYHPRFGIVYVDFENQQRIIKNSGKWFQEFLGQ